MKVKKAVKRKQNQLHIKCHDLEQKCYGRAERGVRHDKEDLSSYSHQDSLLPTWKKERSGISPFLCILSL